MIDECCVDGDELHVFDQALGEEKPVKGIACRWFGLDARQNMILIDRNEREAVMPRYIRQLFQSIL